MTGPICLIATRVSGLWGCNYECQEGPAAFPPLSLSLTLSLSLSSQLKILRLSTSRAIISALGFWGVGFRGLAVLGLSGLGL